MVKVSSKIFSMATSSGSLCAVTISYLAYSHCLTDTCHFVSNPKYIKVLCSRPSTVTEHQGRSSVYCSAASASSEHQSENRENYFSWSVWFQTSFLVFPGWVNHFCSSTQSKVMAEKSVGSALTTYTVSYNFELKVQAVKHFLFKNWDLYQLQQSWNPWDTMSRGRQMSQEPQTHWTTDKSSLTVNCWTDLASIFTKLFLDQHCLAALLSLIDPLWLVMSTHVRGPSSREMSTCPKQHSGLAFAGAQKTFRATTLGLFSAKIRQDIHFMGKMLKIVTEVSSTTQIGFGGCWGSPSPGPI